MRVLGRAVLAFVLATTIGPAAQAQERESEPISRFVLDARGALPRFPADPATASAIDVTTDNLPKRGLGISFGAHVYPLRGKVTLGVGAEMLITHASHTLPPAQQGGADGPTAKARFSVFSPQVSLNFGSSRGWSYVSVGLGRANLTFEQETDPVPDAQSKPRDLNYGGGARWFAQPHLAFTFDLRWHRVAAQEATAAGRPAYGQTRIVVFSAGISVK
jgi:hypothetical protein